MVQLKADMNREYQYNTQRGGGTPDASQYKPLPDGAGAKVNNDVVFSLVAPTKWQLFNPTPQDVEKYNLSPYPVFPDSEWGHISFKVPVHKIPRFSYPNGNVGFAYTICPNAFNKYLVEGLGLSPMFDTPVRCAYCEAAEQEWQTHNARWDDLGVDKKSLSKEGYREQVARDSILKETKRKAYDYKPMDRFVLSVFDQAKFEGKRPLDEGQTAVLWQSWYAPMSVYEKLRNLYNALTENGMPMFYDFDRPSGVQVLTVVKDTTACSKGNMMSTEYDLMNLNKFYQYPAEWLAYLKNDANYADPSSYLHLVSYEEQKYYLSQEHDAAEAKNFNKKPSTMVPGSAIASPPAMVPPGAPPTPAFPAAPQMSAPMPAPQTSSPMPPVAPAAGPPVPVLPQTSAPKPAFVPAAPVPALSGAPIPNRMPPAGNPPPGRIDWDN